jgi:hypothetical protein
MSNALRAGTSWSSERVGYCTGRLPREIQATFLRVMGLHESDEMAIAVECDDILSLKNIVRTTNMIMVGTPGLVEQELPAHCAGCRSPLCRSLTRSCPSCRSAAERPLRRKFPGPSGANTAAEPQRIKRRLRIPKVA